MAVLRILALLPLASLVAAQAAPARPGSSPEPPAGTASPIASIGLAAEGLGTSAGRTVVRLTVSIPRSGLRDGAGLAPRVWSLFLGGEAADGAGGVVDAFREPVEVDLTAAGGDGPFTASVLRSLPPGELVLRLRLEGTDGGAAAARVSTVSIPRMSSEFRAEEAGPPTAAAILLQETGGAPADPGAGDLVRILPPARDVPLGLLRVECEARPPVARVELRLGDALVQSRSGPPWSFEVDLGAVARRQTVRVLGYDGNGRFLDADAWAVGERERRLAVRLLLLPPAEGREDAEVKVAVPSPGGAVAKRVALFLDDRKLAEWSAPPYRARVPAAELEKATLLRASAWDEEGKESSDFEMLKGDGRHVATVDVNLVELNVSVSDGSGRFATGLSREDFTVLEDGAPQELSAFEVAGSLPMTLGLVLDGSGSMGASMPLVRQAATEFVTGILGEEDAGFVVEFRERPTVVAARTRSREALVKAIGEARSAGATAFHDSVVLGLYQFRSLAGRKALVVLTDGRDNYSSTGWPALRRYARTAGVPVFVVGVGVPALDLERKSRMKELADDTGGESFLVGDPRELPEVWRRIESVVRSQYFLSYLARSAKGDDEYRRVEVRVSRPGLRARTIRGYFP